MDENGSLVYLRDDIEKMDKIHQERIFTIIKKHGIEYTKNKNGIFVNISLFKKNVIDEIKAYIMYVDLQHKQLMKVEEDKADYIKKYYSKDSDKDTEKSSSKDTHKDNKDILSLEE